MSESNFPGPSFDGGHRARGLPPATIRPRRRSTGRPARGLELTLTDPERRLRQRHHETPPRTQAEWHAHWNRTLDELKAQLESEPSEDELG